MKWFVIAAYWGFKILKYIFFSVLLALFVMVGFMVIDPYVSVHGMAALWITIGWILSAFVVMVALVFGLAYVYATVEEKYEEIQEEGKEKE